MVVLIGSLFFMTKGLYNVFFKTTAPINEASQQVNSTDSAIIASTNEDDKVLVKPSVKGDKVDLNSLSPVDIRGLLLASAIPDALQLAG